MVTRTDIQAVSPALDQYAQHAVLNDLWKRTDLSLRDAAKPEAGAFLRK